MDYDFSQIFSDEIFLLGKRLTSVNKVFMKDYKFALNVINHEETEEHRKEIELAVEDLLNVAAVKAKTAYRAAFEEVQKKLGMFL